MSAHVFYISICGYDVFTKVYCFVLCHKTTSVLSRFGGESHKHNVLFPRFHLPHLLRKYQYESQDLLFSRGGSWRKRKSNGIFPTQIIGVSSPSTTLLFTVSDLRKKKWHLRIFSVYSRLLEGFPFVFVFVSMVSYSWRKFMRAL